MIRISKDELLDLMEQCRTALVKEQDAHTQIKAALAAATTKLEALEGLPGKWDATPSTFRQTWSPREYCLAVEGYGVCARDLRAALGSPGPSLRERVEWVVGALRGRAASDYDSERAFAYGASADLVQAALEGE